LFKKFHRKDGIEVYTQLLVPFEIKNEVLKNMHNSVMSGHLGKKKTKGKPMKFLKQETFSYFYGIPKMPIMTGSRTFIFQLLNGWSATILFPEKYRSSR
jgi:hypothetical protein